MRNEIKVSNEQLMNTPFAELVPNDGDYIRIVINGEHPAVICCYAGYPYLWSNLDCFDGGGQEYARRFDWDYSWNLDSRRNMLSWCHNTPNFQGVTFSVASDTLVVVRRAKNEFFHNDYAMRNIYTGKHSYHHSHGQGFYNEPTTQDKSTYKIGVELEVECNNACQHDEVTKMRSNWFTMESDGSLGAYGIEFITIPMWPKDIKSLKTWSPMTDYLSVRAKSWSKPTCGLHVHIGREILGDSAEETSETIGKMLYLYHHYLKYHALNNKIFGRLRGYHDNDGKVESGNAAMTLGKECLKLKSVKDKIKGDLTRRSMSERYFDINLQNSKTIEFRRGRGSINAKRITAIVEYCELICKYSRKMKWEAIDADHFYSWCKSKVKKSSALYDFFPSDESCD